MKIEFNLEKSLKNKLTRGLPFEKCSEFDWGNAIYSEDARFFYPERRFIALGYLDNRLHVICFTPIEEGVRIISFRKANLREILSYEQETINH